MNRSQLSPSRWMNWRPTDQIIGDSAEVEPTKPSKPGYVGFVGSPLEAIPNIAEAVSESEHGVPWADWKAAALNRLFQEQGVTGQPGRITAATIRHGEANRERKSGSVFAVDSATTDEQPMSRAEATE